ncbi:DUF3667 domain-containing protein [Sphingomonas oleivorans]|nr:DUF3667 domain-containing protein [Sphingomonas oleivorans]
MGEGIEEVGAVVSGGLAAREIDRLGRGDAAAHGHEGEGAGGACANCGTVRVGSYCHSCGQTGHLHRNLHALIHDIAHGVFHFEGRIWHTLPLLAFRPGELTRRYVQGQRVRFVSPMALFLFSVFLMFAVVSNLPLWSSGKHATAGGALGLNQAETQIADELKEEREKLSELEEARAEAVQEGGKVASIDTKLAKTRKDIAQLEMAQKALSVGSVPKIDLDLDSSDGKNWLERKVEHASKNPELMLYKMKSSGYKYSWALIPISLPFIWLLFAFRRDVGFYDHAVFATYSLSFMSLFVVALSIALALGVSANWVTLAAMIVPPIHMYKQLKYGYGLGRFGATWRTFALLMVVSITSSLFLMWLLYLGSGD